MANGTCRVCGGKIPPQRANEPAKDYAGRVLCSRPVCRTTYVNRYSVGWRGRPFTDEHRYSLVRLALIRETAHRRGHLGRLRPGGREGPGC